MSVLSIGELLDMGGSASTTGLVPYSALEYNASGAISGISGSAIAGMDLSSKQDKLTFGYDTANRISSIDSSALVGMDEAQVSSIASSYATSAASGKEDKLTWAGIQSGNSSFVTSVNNSAFSAKAVISIPTSLLSAGDGFALGTSGTTAILYLNTQGSNSSISAIGGSGLEATKVTAHLHSTPVTEQSHTSNMFAVTNITGDVGIISRESAQYEDIVSTGSGSGSGTNYDEFRIYASYNGQSQYYTAYMPGETYIDNPPTVNPPSAYRYTLESSIGSISGDVYGVPYVAKITDSSYGNVTGQLLYPYVWGTTLPTGCCVVGSGVYGPTAINAVEAAVTAYKEWEVYTNVVKGIISYVPSGNWLSKTNEYVTISGTGTNLGGNSDFKASASFSASAQSMLVPMANFLASLTGIHPAEVKWTGLVSCPFNTKWYLMEQTGEDAYKVLSFDYVPSGSSVVRLNGTTYAYGNGTTCSGVYLSAVFDSEPNNETVTVVEQYGYWNKLTVGTLFGAPYGSN